MIVRCEVLMCPFRNSEGWCTAKVIAVGAHGGCLTVLNRRGEHKMVQANVPPQCKEQIKVVDAE